MSRAQICDDAAANAAGGSLNLGIVNNRGELLVQSEGYTSNPSVQFKPKKSDEYYLASSIPSHYNNESREYSITEYIREDQRHSSNTNRFSFLSKTKYN